MSITEYLTLIDAADDFLKPIIEFAINTGMRTESEILSLKWSQVDLKTGFIRLAAEDTKECKAKNIPINHNVARILDNTVRHINHDYVFTFRNKPIRKLTHFITCCNQAGLTYGYKSENEIVARDIRRTVKTYMVEAGVNEIYRDIILGHSKRGMDIHYIHPDEETLKTAIQKYTKWLDDKIETARSQFVDQAVDQK